MVTNGHPFYVYRARSGLSASANDDEGEWINSDKLIAGDSVLRPDGTWVKVLSVNHVFGEAAVYNFKVERNHDYFVGSAGVSVHNRNFNGENKQTEVKRDGVSIGKYFYDGEGKRVKKVTDLETTIFVYSGEQPVAEYWTKLASKPTTNYIILGILQSVQLF